MKAYIWLFAAAATFWMIYDLAPTGCCSSPRTRRSCRCSASGSPAATTQSFNPLFIMILVPVFAALWVKLGNRVTTPHKFSLGTVHQRL